MISQTEPPPSSDRSTPRLNLTINTELCLPPPYLKLELRPPSVNTGSTAKGRCRHDIFTRNLLGIAGTNLTVRDTEAARQLMRTKHGARPLGPLGAITGYSIHRCDSCRRADDLKLTIVCPCCASSIPPNELISVVPSELLLIPNGWEPALVHYTTTFKGGANAIVCASCGDRHFADTRAPERHYWAGYGVVGLKRRESA